MIFEKVMICLYFFIIKYGASPVVQSVKNLPVTQEAAHDAGDTGSIPGSGRCPGEGHGNPLQYSCLGIPWTEESGRLPDCMGLQTVRHD